MVKPPNHRKIVIPQINCSMSDSNPIDGSPIGALAEMFSNLTVAASQASERADILRLARKKDDLARLVNLLKSTRRYISRSDRNLMVRALLFYQRRHSVDVSTAVRSLLASTKYPIPKEIRDCISLLISKLLTDYTSELCGVRPENDEERFDAMIEDNNLASGVWRDMQAMGIVLCHVMPTTRKMDLLGTKRRDEFFSEFDSRWGFENSSKYIIYTGEASVPVGKTDSADAHVIAGSTLNTIIPLVDGYDLRNGTVGGVFYTEENETMYVITAGHCVLMKSSPPERLA
jgi:hypothetical protein